MTEDTNPVKKIRRSRKRVYETVEPLTSAEPEGRADEIPIEGSDLPPKASEVKPFEPPVAMTAEAEADKVPRALAIIRNYTLISAGVGVVPVPLLDMATMLALQMLMVRKLAKLYDLPFARQRVKSAIVGVIGGFKGGYLGGLALKMIPVIGIVGYATMPTVNAAVSYAVGRVFLQHFESGGTFLDLDPKKVRAYFEEQFRQGKLKP